MSKKRNLGLSLLPATLALGLAGGIFLGKYVTINNLSPEEEKFRTILGLIREEYVDEIDIDSLVERTIPDLLASLDPHSAYIPASELKSVNDELGGSFSGVGVSFQILNDTVKVVEVVSGGPAEKVGIVAGDNIISANGVRLTGSDITNEDVFKALKGTKGSKVTLSVKRSTSKNPLSFDVIRGEVPVISVDSYYMISDGIGYVRVNRFSRNTYDEFINALHDLKDKGAAKFIVDLRGNQGGYMDQAIYMVNEFLPAGQMIVYTKGRTPENEQLAISDGRGDFQDAEITVLTNEFSASASEIFAGAIQDNDRGLVIGRRTFGKGLVQNQTTLNDSSAVRLTVARYFTPSGRCIQKDYVRGKDGSYEQELVDRYTSGEIYNADSIRNKTDLIFKTLNQRTVYGGGGITPDVFVAEDTTGYTSYYINVMNKGLLQKYAFELSDKYRTTFKGIRTADELFRLMPRDNTLLDNFVTFAAKNGVPARWYYINQSRELILSQLKALVARDILGYSTFISILNRNDVVVKKAEKYLKEGLSPKVIKVTPKNE